MLGIAIFTLALVVGQVVAHPPYVTVNDDEDGAHPPYVTVNAGEEVIEVLTVNQPFEMTNPSRVAGGELYQSDMLLSDQQWEALRMRKAIDNEDMRWTEGSDGNPFVPYVFQDSVNKDDVRAGLDHWMEHTCIKFEETTKTDQPHLQFHIGSGCWSAVGMAYWRNGQQISIGNNCNQLGTVVHEVGHAMGFHHEQSRSDRDNYVTILMDNVESGKEHNFDKEVDNNFNVPYDYSSNMHYGMDYFTKNGLPTIVTLDPLAQELIGSRNGLTHRDKLLANKMYNCLGKWLEKCKISSDPCLNDGYTGKDCTCVCPPGTSGSNCESVDDEYYASLRSPLSEKITTEKTITVETPMEGGTTFVKWVVPPTCQKAKVSFTSAALFDQCQYQYLNIKTDDADVVGDTSPLMAPSYHAVPTEDTRGRQLVYDHQQRRLCAEDVSAGVTLTSDSGIIITMINNVNYGFKTTLWTADVTFENIPGCSVTDPPTDPQTDIITDPTTVPTTAPTTPLPVPVIPCTRWATIQVLQDGESVAFESPNFPSEYAAATCRWKFKAANKKSKVSITCEDFSLNGNDNLIINKKSFSKDKTVSSKRLKIDFISSKNTSGPGFRCTVVAN